MSHWFQGWRPPPDSPGPVDDAYRQVRWVRPYRPGPWRVAFFLLGGVVFFIPMMAAFIVLLTPGEALVARLMLFAIIALVAIGIGTLVGRTFSTGVYVNDFGIRIFTVRRLVTLTWDQVADVSDSRSRVRVLGLPFVRVEGRVVVVTTPDAGPLRTPVNSVGLDFLGRAEAYDAAALALERWWRDAPRSTP